MLSLMFLEDFLAFADDSTLGTHMTVDEVGTLVHSKVIDGLKGAITEDAVEGLAVISAKHKL